MSSILKALKKLETNPSQGVDPAPEKKHKTSREASKRSRRFFLLGIICITAGFTAGGMWIFFGENQLFLNRLFSSAPQPPSGTPEKTIRHAVPQPTAGETRNVLDAPVPPEPSPKKKPMRRAIKKEPMPQSHMPSTPVDDPKPKVYDRPSEKDVSNTLSLQALVWSDTPTKRFVVINGQIVKEGGAIDGILVKGIGWDFVELTDGKRVWRMKHR